MRCITYTYEGRTAVGELAGDAVYPLAWEGRLIDLIAAGAQPGRSGEPIAAAAVKIEAPLRPGKIVAVGKNYAAHAKETGSSVPSAPLLFAKLPSAVIGQGDAITWRTSITTEVDWEGELAVVIGRRGKDIAEGDALDWVFGFTAANDVSARDLQNRIDGQWTRAKGLDTFCPLGPCVVTRDEIADPQALTVQTTVNGVLMQNGQTADMVYGVAALVAYISRMFTLEPGDVILTGTPSGVGLGRTPPIFLQDGDIVSVRISGIGELTNPCRALPE